MTEADLRALLLLQAIESGTGRPVEPAGADWAGDEARRRLGEGAPPEAWLGERARLSLARLAEREPVWRPALAAAADTGLARVLPLLVLPAAAVLGAAGVALGAAQQINLLAPPLLGLLAWNLGVYALLLLQALRRPATAAAPGPLRRSLLALLARARTQFSPGGPAAVAQAVARFHADWLAATAALQARRGVVLLHAGAAALAAGALASLYAHGLVQDYRAGWDSTFLDAAGVRLLLGALLGPAAALSGQTLPDAAALAGLRLASGGGEGAARWIHLWALTLALAVVLPRLLLAVGAALQARRLACRLPLPDDDRLRRLLRAAAGQRLPLLVLPYSFRLDAAHQAALLRALDAAWGPGVVAQVLPSLPLGAEDDLPATLPAPLPPTVVALFALAATPEREHHGAFLRALAGHAGGARIEVMVDESGFRQRLAGSALSDRLAQRRAAWQALLATLALTPQFIDLGAAEAAGAA